MANRICIALIVLLFLPGIYLTVADLMPAPHQEDFGAYYVAAKALSNGVNPYDPEVASHLAAVHGVDHFSPYIYPPLLAVLLRPLAALPYSTAASVWFVLSAAALLLALVLLRPATGLPWRTYRWVCAGVFFLPPVHHTLQHGQINHFLLLLIVGAAQAGAAGGAWVGIAAALKVFPGALAAAYFSKGRMAALVTLVASSALLTLAASLIAAAASIEFVQRIGPQLAVDRRLAPNNQSIYAVIARWFEPQWFVTPIIDAPAVGRFVSYAAAMGIIALTIRVLASVRSATAPTLHIRRLSLVLSATLLLSPIVWDHYYVLLLLPMAEVYRSSSCSAKLRTLMLASAVLLLSHRYWPLMSSLQSPVFMSGGAAGVFVLWIALLKMLSYDRVCAVKPRPSVTSPSAI